MNTHSRESESRATKWSSMCIGKILTVCILLLVLLWLWDYHVTPFLHGLYFVRLPPRVRREAERENMYVVSEIRSGNCLSFKDKIVH